MQKRSYVFWILVAGIRDVDPLGIVTLLEAAVDVPGALYLVTAASITDGPVSKYK